MHEKGKGYKSPGTICCVTMKGKLDLCQYSELKNVIGLKSTKARVQKYCKEKNITPPWDVEPDKILITNKKGQRKKDRMGEETSPTENIHVSNIGGSSSASIDAAVEERIASRLEKKFEAKMASNASGSSFASQVNELMEKMKSMNSKMETMEKKLDKVDEIEKSLVGLVGLVKGLMDRFDKLEAKKPTEVPA